MSAAQADDFSDRMPTSFESANANQLRQIIAGQVREDEPTTLKLALAKGETAEVTLSPAIARTFLDVLRLIASGSGFQLIPINTELTTQQSADLLNVSRPFLIKLLEEGAIPFTKVGRHRRIRAEDLFAYKARRDETRAKALGDMAAEDAEKGAL
ncbi:MAG: helix-turn-helix domain-containing protein [Caulobacterales bacterium]|nr:helix-turn-helix domain-containing protein [Caulobacterales bacterium]